MTLDILTFGEAIVEVMRVDVDQPLDQPALFSGPYASGAPFIFAAQAARLGLRSACIGAIGDDAFGRLFLRHLKEDGVDTRAVFTLDGYTTGVAFIAYSSDGSRDYVFHMRHAASGQLSPDMLREEWFDGLKVLHITGSSLAMSDAAMAVGHTALTLAQQYGAKISFDPNIRPQLMPLNRVREAFAPFVEAADVLLPTLEEALLLTEQTTETGAIAHFLTMRDKIVALTRGVDGCTIYTRISAIDVPAYSVEEIDPTGAGDCFDAGFLSRWLRGDRLEDAARFANACGAIAVSERGPMAGARSVGEVQRFIASHTPSP
jgi:sugar/nucleoside kinase (ribokinase family)